VSLPKSRGSYQSCYDILDAALNNEKGVRILVNSFTAATMLRMRLHMARQLDRDFSKERYEEGHFMYGASEYDKLIVKLRETRDDPPKIYVYIEHNNIDWGDVEMLSEVAEETRPALPPQQTLALPPPRTVSVEEITGGSGFVMRRRV